MPLQLADRRLEEAGANGQLSASRWHARPSFWAVVIRHFNSLLNIEWCFQFTGHSQCLSVFPFLKKIYVSHTEGGKKRLLGRHIWKCEFNSEAHGGNSPANSSHLPSTEDVGHWDVNLKGKL